MFDPSKTRRQRFAAAALFHVACELEPDELRAFLLEACAGDELLVREVELLLAADRRLAKEADREGGPADEQA